MAGKNSGTRNRKGKKPHETAKWAKYNLLEAYS